MKRFRILMAALLLLSAANNVLAQQTAEAMAAADTEWMAEVLNLDQQQVEQVQRINLDHAQQVVALKTSDIDKGAMKKQYHALLKARHEELANVLTAEQYTAFQARWKQQDDGASD